MPSIGAVELVVLAVALVGLVAVVAAVRIGSDRRRTPPDRMPQAWLEQQATADPTSDPTERI